MFERAQISFVLLANVFHIELVKVLLPILKLNVRLRLHDVNNTYSFRFNIVCVLTKDFSVSTIEPWNLHIQQLEIPYF